MQTERFPLLASMVLQGVVALTFGLAFVGLWRGFRRHSALLFAMAFLVYAAGVWFSVAGLATAFVKSWPLVLRGFVGFPLQVGALLFRPATDSLAYKDVYRERARYLLAATGVALIVLPGQAALALWAPEIQRYLFPYVVPRIVLGAAFLWAAWPLLRLPTAQRQTGYSLVGLSLLTLAVRMFGSVAFEAVQIARGATQQPESALLSILQVGFMIVLGVSVSVLLTDAESRRAMAATQTIRETSEALKASEARFRFVAEYSSDLQVLVGGDGVLRYVAASSEQLLGIAPSHLEGRQAIELVHEDDRASLVAALNAMASPVGAPAVGRTPVLFMRVQHRSGEWRQFEATGQRVAQQADAAIDQVFVFSMRDVTEQRRLEGVLLQSQKLDSLGQMAGSIAHDFNNTLAAVRGGVELLREEIASGGRISSMVDEIDTAARSGTALIGQLLAFARRDLVRPERFDVALRVRALEGMIVRVVGRRISVSIDDASTPIMVRADPGQFDQVLLNLATNARDAMPSGGQLCIRVRRDEPERSALPDAHAPEVPPRVHVDVRDTGTGIPPDILDRIFEPFFTTKEEGLGTGLGLATAYGFARQFGGALTVSSTVGEGTRFSLALPIDALPAVLAGAYAAPPAIPAIPAIPVRPPAVSVP